MSEDPPAIAYVDVAEELEPGLREAVVEAWLAHGAIPSREVAEARVGDLACVARDASGAVAAMATTFVRHVGGLGHPMFHFRTFVLPDFRTQGIATRMLIRVRDRLDARFRAGHDPAVIGIIFELQNPSMRRAYNFAVMPHSKFVFIGRTPNGTPAYVHYFHGARI